MMARCRLFAAARDLVGRSEIELTLDEQPTIGDLRARLAEEYPSLAAIAPHLMFAIGTEYVTDRTHIPAGAEIVGIPPVSGG